MKKLTLSIICCSIIIIMFGIVIAGTGQQTNKYQDKDSTNFTTAQKTSLSAMGMTDYKIEDKQTDTMMVRCIKNNQSYVIKPTARNKLKSPNTVYIEKTIRCYGGTDKADLDTKEDMIVKQEIDKYETNKNKTSTIIGTGKVNVK